MTKERLKDIIIGLIITIIHNSNESMYVIEDCYDAGMSKEELINLGFGFLFNEEDENECCRIK